MNSSVVQEVTHVELIDRHWQRQDGAYRGGGEFLFSFPLQLESNYLSVRRKKEHIIGIPSTRCRLLQLGISTQFLKPTMAINHHDQPRLLLLSNPHSLRTMKAASKAQKTKQQRDEKKNEVVLLSHSVRTRNAFISSCNQPTSPLGNIHKPTIRLCIACGQPKT